MRHCLNRSLNFFILAVCLIGLTSCGRSKQPQYVILKADDLVFDQDLNITQGFELFHEVIKGFGIKASAGVIGYPLSVAGDNLTPEEKAQRMKQIKMDHDSGTLELWKKEYKK